MTVETPLPAPHRVVYHNNGGPAGDQGYFGRLLNSLRNHRAAVPGAEIVIVCHAGGLDLFERAGDDESLRAELEALRVAGVRFLVCANTLATRGLVVSDLAVVGEQDVVPSGVAELAARQHAGFAYIHL
jgi:hypothetical protein